MIPRWRHPEQVRCGQPRLRGGRRRSWRPAAMHARAKNRRQPCSARAWSVNGACTALARLGGATPLAGRSAAGWPAMPAQFALRTMAGRRTWPAPVLAWQWPYGSGARRSAHPAWPGHALADRCPAGLPGPSPRSGTALHDPAAPVLWATWRFIRPFAAPLCGLPLLVRGAPRPCPQRLGGATCWTASRNDARRFSLWGAPRDCRTLGGALLRRRPQLPALHGLIIGGHARAAWRSKSTSPPPAWGCSACSPAR